MPTRLLAKISIYKHVYKAIYCILHFSIHCFATRQVGAHTYHNTQLARVVGFVRSPYISFVSRLTSHATFHSYCCVLNDIILQYDLLYGHKNKTTFYEIVADMPVKVFCMKSELSSTCSHVSLCRT